MSVLDDVVAQAITDFARHGFDSDQRLNTWLERIREAAQASAAKQDRFEAIKRSMHAAFARAVDRGGLERSMDIPRWTIERLKPKLRAELDRRILSNANLIKLNREEAIAKTLRRFSGWATSIPTGGSEAVEKREEAQSIKQSVKDLRYIERRAGIDQTHKLIASIRDIAAVDNGAIAAIWHSHWRTPGYQYRKEHKERDGVVYLIRDSWAQREGLVKPAGHQYTDEITQPGEEVYCSCSYQYLFSLGRLPDECLTEKGRAALTQH